MADPEIVGLLDKRAAARFLDISHRSLSSRAWRSRVGIPSYRVGALIRFDPRELREWLEQRREPAA